MMLPQQQVEHRCHDDAAFKCELATWQKTEKESSSEYFFFFKQKKIVCCLEPRVGVSKRLLKLRACHNRKQVRCQRMPQVHLEKIVNFWLLNWHCINLQCSTLCDNTSKFIKKNNYYERSKWCMQRLHGCLFLLLRTLFHRRLCQIIEQSLHTFFLKFKTGTFAKIAMWKGIWTKESGIRTFLVWKCP